MRARSDRHDEVLELRALYSVGALARAGGVTCHLLMRLLRANGVRLLNAGRAVLVPLSEIEEHVPPLWQSLVAAERVKADAREAARRRADEGAARGE